ncbi:hypothetical protein HP567_019750 [Brevibacillus sp. M2.1A]|uniref:hypothetical protein n=1 Tax=Brevibacillus TaxID=55080 RepID=UPI00156A8BE5|nr:MULTISPECIES: hypothetical protein [Brevibacillus]MBY0088660.1 hypothetical protein [Brevibacillus brevis]MCC8436785.1 hypothetical protein [Brevibacillus sp. M2.1A]MCE0448777.1 hypothetical protein [Brevibacillus sp. AF8]UKK98960.1 hypothetical protein FO446_16705 [Brevibacillus brevis]
MIFHEYSLPHYWARSVNHPIYRDENSFTQTPILIHLSSPPDQGAKYFSSFISAAYWQRLGIQTTMFFNGEGVNGLVKGRLVKMIGSPNTEQTVTQQLGMEIPQFLYGDNPKNILEWALTFVRFGGRVAYCGTTNTWVGNAMDWEDRSNMERFAIPLNLHQVASLLSNQEMKYIAF